jgi:photosystem II stability/assembly factor-like uncharacterized protein
MQANPLRIALLPCAALVSFWLTALLFGQDSAGLSGPVTLIQADPHHQGALLAGTAAARLFRSRDDGDTWQPLLFPAELRSTLHAMLIDPTTPDVYWAAVSSENPQYAGAFRSTDAGATWQPVAGLERKQVWALVFWRGDARVIAAGAEDGVFLSRDGGENWKRLASAASAWPRPVVSLAFDPTNRNTLYAGTPHLAWKTVDGGAIWRPIHKGMAEDSDIFALDVDVKQRGRLFAAACSGLYRSLDGGDTWSSLQRAVGAGFRTYVVVQKPGRPGVVFAGTSNGLMQSPDGGATWHSLSADAARSVAFDPADPLRVFVATDQGVIRSEDGGIHFHGPRQNPEKQ